MLSTVIEKAKHVCVKAHSGQFDKGGSPYYQHPFAVADMCETEDEKIVAYLHDVVEDTNITLHDLHNFGFSGKIVSAVNAITKRKGEEYRDYLYRVKTNDIARVVKLADLRHNSQLRRLNRDITDEDLKRVQKYQNSINYLKGGFIEQY